MISNYINFYELERNICPDCVGDLGGGGVIEIKEGG